MAAEFVVTSSKKLRVEEPEFPTNTCVLCGALFLAKNPASTPDLTKIQSLIAACSERKDEVGLRLLAKQSSILDGSVTILYHRHCRSTYTSKLHLKRNADKQVKTGETQSSSCEYNRMTRSSLHLNTFDWKKNCFHCGAECQSMSVNGAVSHWEEVRQV